MAKKQNKPRSTVKPELVQEYFPVEVDQYDNEDEDFFDDDLAEFDDLDINHPGPVVNRGVLIVRGKKPFVDWINSTTEKDDRSPPFTIEQVNRELCSYLIPPFETDAAYERYIKRKKLEIFQAELTSWSSDEDQWPPKMTTKVFDEWFDIEYHSLVFDITGGDDIGYEFY